MRTFVLNIVECFLFVLDSIFYVFTNQSDNGIYKSIEDYINGLKRGFENALDYYFSKTRKIKNYPDFKKFLLDELYSICKSDIEIINYKLRITVDPFTRRQRRYEEPRRWVFDTDKFKIYIDKMLKMLSIEIEYQV